MHFLHLCNGVTHPMQLYFMHAKVLRGSACQQVFKPRDYAWGSQTSAALAAPYHTQRSLHRLTRRTWPVVNARHSTQNHSWGTHLHHKFCLEAVHVQVFEKCRRRPLTCRQDFVQRRACNARNRSSTQA